MGAKKRESKEKNAKNEELDGWKEEG